MAVLYFSHTNLRDYGRGRGLEEPVDAVLVLGGGLDPDAVPSYSTRRRVDAAVALLATGKTRNLIFLGGPARLRREHTAGELMRNYALSLGAAPSALHTETRSVSTLQNLRFGFALAEERGFKRLAILTDAFHLERTRQLAVYFGRPDIGLAAARGLEVDNIALRVWSILREALAWWYNLAKIGAWEAMAAAGVSENTRQGLIR